MLRRKNLFPSSCFFIFSAVRKTNPEVMNIFFFDTVCFFGKKDDERIAEYPDQEHKTITLFPDDRILRPLFDRLQ